MREFPGQDIPKEVIEEAEENLPDGFWDMPGTFIESDNIRTLYFSLYKKLLKENPDADTIEVMMIERAAALYAYMRNMEATEGYQNSSSYRQLSALWNQMANDLRKTRNVNFDENKIREEIAREYMSVINLAIKGFDAEVAHTVKRRLLMALESAERD